MFGGSAEHRNVGMPRVAHPGVVRGEDARVCACVWACAVTIGECVRPLAIPSCRRDLAHSMRLGACPPGLGHAEPCRAGPALAAGMHSSSLHGSTGGPAVFLLHGAQGGGMVHSLQTAVVVCKAMQHGAGKMGAVRQ